MPRAKADSVVIHRLDVQPGVKDSLDAYLAASALTNAVGTAGQILTGMFSALAVPMGGILAALVAKEGIEEIAAAAADKFREAGEALVEPLRNASDYYRDIFTALNSTSGWLLSPSPFLEDVNGGKKPTEMDMLWVYDGAHDFWTSGASRRADTEWIRQHVADGGDAANPSPPPQGWYGPYFKGYFPPGRVIDYIKAQAKNPISRYTKNKHNQPTQWIIEGLEELLL